MNGDTVRVFSWRDVCTRFNEKEGRNSLVFHDRIGVCHMHRLVARRVRLQFAHSTAHSGLWRA